MKCGQGWTRDLSSPRRPCTGCGAVDWDQEYALENYVGARNEYYVVGERVGEGHLMTLELVGTWNRNATASVPLCHRLKDDYRHRKSDLHATHGRELVIAFDRIPGDPQSRWGLNLRPLTAFENRRERTDVCRRHQWAIRAVRESYDINGAADKIHCACPSEPSCEVCTVAAQFAEDRRRPGSDGTGHWADLQNAVMRDLGRLA